MESVIGFLQANDKDTTKIQCKLNALHSQHKVCPITDGHTNLEYEQVAGNPCSSAKDLLTLIIR